VQRAENVLFLGTPFTLVSLNRLLNLGNMVQYNTRPLTPIGKRLVPHQYQTKPLCRPLGAADIQLWDTGTKEDHSLIHLGTFAFVGPTNQCGNCQCQIWQFHEKNIKLVKVQCASQTRLNLIVLLTLRGVLYFYIHLYFGPEVFTNFIAEDSWRQSSSSKTF
jgi:hypothetical protein